MSGEAAAPGAWPAKAAAGSSKAAAGNIKAVADVATIVQASRPLLKAEWFICRSYFFMPAGMFM
jgi:hypothetical protein